MEMMRKWSPSLTQTMKVFSGLWKMPLPCGHHLCYPLSACILSLPLNSKWSLMKPSRTSSVIPSRGNYWPCRSSGSRVKIFLANSSIFSFSSTVF